MNMNNQMEEAESSILHTYNRFPVVFERGEGVHLFDSEGSKYLDFAAGIAVNSLGYHYPGYDEALKEQINKLTHISNLYYNEPIIEAGAKLVNASRMDKAFFTNSGTEAIEGLAYNYIVPNRSHLRSLFESFHSAKFFPHKPKNFHKFSTDDHLHNSSLWIESFGSFHLLPHFQDMLLEALDVTLMAYFLHTLLLHPSILAGMKTGHKRSRPISS